MKRAKLIRHALRPVRDFVLGLGVFAAVAGPSLASGTTGSPTLATPVFEPLMSGPDNPMALLIVLALMFASLFTLNLWFARHVALAYGKRRS